MTVEYEFFGPVGVSFLLVGMPAVTLGLPLLCTAGFCPLPWELGPHLSALSLDELKSVAGLLTLDALAVILAWWLLLAVFYFVLTGKTVKGTELSTGKRLEYKINALPSMVVSFCLLYIGVESGLIDLVYIHDNFLQLIMAAYVLATLVSVYLYVTSFRSGVLLSHGGQTGNVIYDFFIGRELNPRVGRDFDWKFFMELRPGLIGWVIIDLAMAVYQYRTIGYVTNSMILVVLFHTIYVVDALVSEESILTTMDITTEGFGWMLMYGDTVWVPFTYSTCARYLADFPLDLSYPAVGAILVVQAVGLLVFRLSNSQKDQFRRDPTHPSVAHLKTLATKRGTRLIVSSWWGMCRHPNYLGDWLMAVAWSLPCGFASPYPYFYPMYFAVLLLHRASRDDAACRAKYGDADWNAYKTQVPYLILPYVW